MQQWYRGDCSSAANSTFKHSVLKTYERNTIRRQRYIFHWAESHFEAQGCFPTRQAQNRGFIRIKHELKQTPLHACCAISYSLSLYVRKRQQQFHQNGREEGKFLFILPLTFSSLSDKTPVNWLLRTSRSNLAAEGDCQQGRKPSPRILESSVWNQNIAMCN